MWRREPLAAQAEPDRADVLAAHGHLAASVARRLSRAALAKVVLPCARAMGLERGLEPSGLRARGHSGPA